MIHYIEPLFFVMVRFLLRFPMLALSGHGVRVMDAIHKMLVVKTAYRHVRPDPQAVIAGKGTLVVHILAKHEFVRFHHTAGMIHGSPWAWVCLQGDDRKSSSFFESVFLRKCFALVIIGVFLEHADERELRAVLHLVFLKQVLDVILDRAHGDFQVLRNTLVFHASFDEGQNLFLPWS
jgi:hypothetical protein